MGEMRKPRVRNLELHVTEEIIDRAQRSDSTSCLFADAMKIAVPGGVRPQVDLQTMSITVPERGLRYHWLTPRAVQRTLLNFDAGAEISPEVVRLTQGWTTPVRTHSTLGRDRKKSRAERLEELESLEQAGTLTDVDKRALSQMRATDERRRSAGQPDPDRTDRAARPPAGSLSNRNGRKYGLRLTKLTQHGVRLVEDGTV